VPSNKSMNLTKATQADAVVAFASYAQRQADMMLSEGSMKLASRAGLCPGAARQRPPWPRDAA
jgi:hypothetical protein